MSKQNKWAGNLGKVASGGSSTNGGNVYKPVPEPAHPTSKSSVKDNTTKMPQKPGDDMGMTDVSTHNDINAFTRGIKSRGPYGGPSFASLNNSKMDMQKTNTSDISKFDLPK